MTAPEDPDAADGAAAAEEGARSLLDERAAEALVQAQAAGRALVRAARAVLDVAESLLDDPAPLAEAFAAAAAAGRNVVGADTSRRPVVGSDDAAPEGAPGDGTTATTEASSRRRSGVQRIRVAAPEAPAP